MKIDERREERRVVLSLTGRLDAAGAAKLETRVSEIAGKDEVHVVLDCAGMSYIGSAGIRGVLISAKNCLQMGGNLAVAALRPECRKVLEVSGLLRFLDHPETVDAALAGRSGTAGSRGRGRPSSRSKRGLEIGERRQDPAVVVTLAGRLDGAGAPMLESLVDTMVARGDIRVVLDCARMSYVNSTGLRILLLCARKCSLEEGKLAIADLTDECKSVLDMSGFLSIIEYHETTKAALTALAADL